MRMNKITQMLCVAGLTMASASAFALEAWNGQEGVTPLKSSLTAVFTQMPGGSVRQTARAQRNKIKVPTLGVRCATHLRLK